MRLDSRIRAAAHDLMGLRYGRSARFPRGAPGIPSSLVGNATAIDCSSLTAYCVLHAYAGRLADPGRLYRDLQVFDAARPWSPVEGVKREGIGVEPPLYALGAWYLVQRWRLTSPLRGGHALLVCDHGIGGIEVLESVSRDYRGPAYRTSTWAELGQGGQVQAAMLIDTPTT